MAAHKPNLSHDLVRDFRRPERFTPADLWAIVQPYLDDTETASVLVDDSVQDQRFTHKHLKARRILFDSWYASVDNLKLIHRSGWPFFTTRKSN